MNLNSDLGEGAGHDEQILPFISFAIHRMPTLISNVWRAVLPTELAYQMATRLEINGQLIPGPIPAPPGPTVQPFAAEMIRRDTERAIAAGAIAEDVEVPEVEDGVND